MSIFPVFNASFVGLVLMGIFCWRINLILVGFIFILCSILLYIYDSVEISFHYESAFWLFILSEVIVFGSLFVCCFYFDNQFFMNISSPLEIPFLGCFLLLGSSITVTGFHHVLNWQFSWILLAITIILGLGFVALQLVELNEVFINLFDTSFHACSFCVIGLHFSHVLLGIVGLTVIMLVGAVNFGFYRCTVLTWYWHFVDYIWLFVYTFIYVC